MGVRVSTWRVSFRFRPAIGAESTANSSAGWSENWYYALDVDAAGIGDAAENWIAQRIELLSPGWRIDKARFAIWPGTRTAFTLNVPAGMGTGVYPLGGTSTDEQPYDVLVNNAVCVSAKGRNYPLGGIASDVVDAGGVYVAPGPFTARYVFWATQLSSGWAVRRSTVAFERLVLGVETSGAFGAVLPSPIRPAIKVADLTGGPAVGATVRVSGVVGFSGINGTWRVADFTTFGGFGYVLLSQKRNLRVNGLYDGGGVFRSFSYALDRVNFTTPSRGSSRKRGGLPDRPRGRRSMRIC